MISFHEDDNVSLYLSHMRVIEHIKSSVQYVELFEHHDLGKILIINGEIQHIEKWSHLYHESLIHIPMMFLEKPRSVLILGGGDLYAAEKLLLYPSIEKVVLCDHDIEVLNITRRHYSHGDKVYNDKRFCPIIADAGQYIRTCNETYDLIINDCFDLSVVSIEGNVFQKLYDLLTPEGVCSDLIYRHIFDKHILDETKQKLFLKHNTVLSLVAVPEYPGILHLLTMWGKSSLLSQSCKKTHNGFQKSLEFRNKCNYFDSRYCQYYLYLPPYIKELLN